jgi:hypothetical protein
MSQATAENTGRMTRRQDYDWRGPPLRTRGQESSSGSWLLTGLAVVGLGVLAWYYLGPDLKRYMKIRSM